MVPTNLLYFVLKLESYYRNHVMVMLLDYQQNDFRFGISQNGNRIRNREDDPLPHITEIQDALESFYIKLRASLARNRIRETALTVEDLLPKEEKEKNEYVCHQPIYAYVNTLRTTVEEVCSTLEHSGFIKDSTLDYSDFSGRRFAIDVHLNDVIVFPRDVKFDVYNHDLVQWGFLVVQVSNFWAFFLELIVFEILKILRNAFKVSQTKKYGNEIYKADFHTVQSIALSIIFPPVSLFFGGGKG